MLQLCCMWNQFPPKFVFSLPKKVKTKKKEEGMEKKDKTGEVVNSSFKMPLLHKSLVLTRHPHGLALPWPLQGTVSWCSVSEQGGNTEAWIFQGRGFLISSSHCFCLCLAASWVTASQAVSLALCKSCQQKRVASNEPGCWSGDVQQRSSRQECPEEGDASQHPHSLQHPD